MAKRPRLKGAGLYHHIYNRGNDRHPIFKEYSDYERYLKYLFNYGRKYKIDIIAYALMQWHLHLFIFDHLGKVSKFINVLHDQYAQIFNKVYGRVGHVFEGRFKNKVVDANNYGIWLSRYIHRQPVEANLVSSPEDYEWTSYLVYIGKKRNILLKPGVILDQFGNNRASSYNKYKKFVEGDNVGPIDWREVELSSQPIIGDEKFVEEVHLKFGKESFEEIIIKDPLGLVSSRLNVSVDVLKHPNGNVQRGVRSQAIVILGKEFDFGVRKIARIFNVSPSLVTYILKK